MTFPEFLDKAEAGGWPDAAIYRVCQEHGLRVIEAVLLKPDAWKAVGKVSGWYEGQYKQVMEDMIAPLCAGGTTEEYLATL